MTTLSIAEKIKGEPLFYSDFFYSGGKRVPSSPKWAMSLKAAGSMRFKYGEENENRKRFFSCLFGEKKEIASIELIHSKKVFAINHASELNAQKGDGIITNNKCVVPVITAADCMPIFLFEPSTCVFASLHSGWRGTGIVEEAIRISQEKYKAKAQDFLVVLAPHIQDCCYTVEKERADYFFNNFSKDCVQGLEGSKYKLSLAKANIALLKKIGVKDENITLCTDCTSCKKDEDGNFPFGSFRRETGARVGKAFTVQAAFCYFE